VQVEREGRPHRWGPSAFRHDRGDARILVRTCFFTRPGLSRPRGLNGARYLAKQLAASGTRCPLGLRTCSSGFIARLRGLVAVTAAMREGQAMSCDSSGAFFGHDDVRTLPCEVAEAFILDLWYYPPTYRDIPMWRPRDRQGVATSSWLRRPRADFQRQGEWRGPKRADTNTVGVRGTSTAIPKSAKQVRGGQRWIAPHPDRSFLEPTLKQASALTLPPLDRGRPCIVVTSGADATCRQLFKGRNGSLVIKQDVRGEGAYESVRRGVCSRDVAPMAPSSTSSTKLR